MKKALLGLTIMGLFMQNGLSQCDLNESNSKRNESSLKVRAEVGRDLFDMGSRSLYSVFGVKAELRRKNIYSDFDTRIDNFATNSYSNTGLGYYVFDKKGLSVGPKISFLMRHQEFFPGEEVKIFNFRDQIGTGLKIDYGNKLEGNFVLSPSKNPLYAAECSWSIKESELELFSRGSKEEGICSGVKFTTRPFGEYFSLFGEYSIRQGEREKFPRDFLNFGITFKGD